MVQEENINVVARVRPFSERNENFQRQSCLQLGPSSITVNYTTIKEKKYELTRVFNEEIEQATIFAHVGQPIIDGFVDGINGTIFAYGQTGSGKTYTMLGPDGNEAINPENRGIIPRAIEAIFAALNAEAKKLPDCFKFSLKCSFLELYNEKLFDLLEENNVPVKIQSCLEQITVDGAELEVTTPKECMDYLWRGLVQRKVAETKMNHESSRSHAIFMLTLATEHVDGDVINRRSSRLNLVDLAGSERQSQTNNAGLRLREAGSINKSLSILARVIRTLAEAKPNQFIPYRDSLLTFLLRDSLGGNARTTVVVNIHPNAHFAGDTVSTLNFAENVKKVKNTATVNEAISCKDIESWQAEIGRLRRENAELISGRTEMMKDNANLVAENEEQKAMIDALQSQINSYLSRSGRRMGFAEFLRCDRDSTVPGRIDFDADEDANSSLDISTAQRKHRRQTMFISNPLPPPSVSDLQERLAKAEKDLEEEEKALQESEIEVHKLNQVVIEKEQRIRELVSSEREKINEILEHEQKRSQLESDISSYLEKIGDLEARQRRDSYSIIELKEEIDALYFELAQTEAAYNDKMTQVLNDMRKANEEWNMMKLEKLEVEKQRDHAEKELALYTGHSNHAQKIHHLEKMKTEMVSLKSENAKLKSVMKAKGIPLSEKDKENKTPTLNYRW